MYFGTKLLGIFLDKNKIYYGIIGKYHTVFHDFNDFHQNIHLTCLKNKNVDYSFYHRKIKLKLKKPGPSIRKSNLSIY